MADAPQPRPATDTPPVAEPGSTGTSSLVGSDWPSQATDTVVDLVASVRDKTTGPLLTAARAVVYGVIIAVLGLAALVVLCVALIRFTDVYLPGGVWSAYLLVGGLLTLGGMALWTQRTASDDGD